MDDNSTEKLAYRVDDACTLLGIGRTSLYKLIAGGQLKTVRIAGRRHSAGGGRRAWPRRRWRRASDERPRPSAAFGRLIRLGSGDYARDGFAVRQVNTDKGLSMTARSVGSLLLSFVNRDTGEAPPVPGPSRSFVRSRCHLVWPLHRCSSAGARFAPWPGRQSAMCPLLQGQAEIGGVPRTMIRGNLTTQQNATESRGSLTVAATSLRLHCRRLTDGFPLTVPRETTAKLSRRTINLAAIADGDCRIREDLPRALTYPLVASTSCSQGRSTSVRRLSWRTAATPPLSAAFSIEQAGTKNLVRSLPQQASQRSACPSSFDG